MKGTRFPLAHGPMVIGLIGFVLGAGILFGGFFRAGRSSRR
jgi:hypothetical protein